MVVYPISELDTEDMETYLIGIASSPEKAISMILEYYGSYEEVRHWDYEEPLDMVFGKHLLVRDHMNREYGVKVTVSKHTIDSL